MKLSIAPLFEALDITSLSHAPSWLMDVIEVGWKASFEAVCSGLRTAYAATQAKGLWESGIRRIIATLRANSQAHFYTPEKL